MLYERLSELERKNSPITVGIIGAGTFGTQIISQICHMKGMRASAVADLELERARQALKIGKTDDKRIVSAKTTEDINDSIDQDRLAVTTNAELLIQSKVDIIVEVTGNVQIAAKYGYSAIMAKKHIGDKRRNRRQWPFIHQATTKNPKGRTRPVG